MYRALRLVLLTLGCFLVTCLGVLAVIFWPAIREYVALPSRPAAPGFADAATAQYQPAA